MRVAAGPWLFGGSLNGALDERSWHADVLNHDCSHRRYFRHRLLPAPGACPGGAEHPRLRAVDRSRPRGEGRARDTHRRGSATVDRRHRATASRIASGNALPSSHARGRSPTARCASLVQRRRNEASRGWRRGRTRSRRQGNVAAPALRGAVGHRREWRERGPGVPRASTCSGAVR